MARMVTHNNEYIHGQIILQCIHHNKLFVRCLNIVQDGNEENIQN